jgi:Tol biopolymer transport system component
MLELQMTDYGNADPATFRDTAPQFYCIGLYGNNPRRLTYHTFDWVSGNLPTFSPDGKQMAYYEKDMLCLRAVDGTLEKYLCKVNYPDGDYLSPVFQLNGKSIVFKDTEEIDGRTAPVMKSYSLTDGTVRKLTAQDFVEQSSPAFNADKTKIVFAKDNPPAIFIANPDHTGEIQLTKARTIYERDSMPAFSPDGGSIVFKRSDDLFAMNTDTSQLRRLNPPGSHVIEFTFTPDGTQVIFSARPEKLVR